jgi:hypothetical protein
MPAEANVYELATFSGPSVLSTKTGTPPAGSEAELATSPAAVLGSTNPEARAREEEAVSLPPIDGGLQAWTFVFCAFILECLVWGFPFSCAPRSFLHRRAP